MTKHTFSTFRFISMALQVLTEVGVSLVQLFHWFMQSLSESRCSGFESQSSWIPIFVPLMTCTALSVMIMKLKQSDYVDALYSTKEWTRNTKESNWHRAKKCILPSNPRCFQRERVNRRLVWIDAQDFNVQSRWQGFLWWQFPSFVDFCN